MGRMVKENFQITDKETGKKYWISRSIAVVALVIVEDEPNGSRVIEKIARDRGYSVYTNPNYVFNKYVAVNKRGNGTPNYQGCWNIPVGYLNWGESLKEACTRELMEEQQIYVAPEKWKLWEDNPFGDVVEGNPAQDVGIRFRATLTMDEYNKAVKEGEAKKKDYKGEYNEVEGRELMLLNEDNLDRKGWAFNHKDLLRIEMKR